MAQVLSALVSQGHRVSRSHTDPMAIKTDAPPRAIWDILRCWTKQPECLTQLGNRKVNVSGTAPAAAILKIEPLVQADFSIVPEVAMMLSSKKVSQLPCPFTVLHSTLHDPCRRLIPTAIHTPMRSPCTAQCVDPCTSHANPFIHPCAAHA
jgi:hypothetical protein